MQKASDCITLASGMRGRELAGLAAPGILLSQLGSMSRNYLSSDVLSRKGREHRSCVRQASAKSQPVFWPRLPDCRCEECRAYFPLNQNAKPIATESLYTNGDTARE